MGKLHEYLSLKIVDLLPAKTRVLLPSTIRHDIINKAVTQFGGKEKLAKFFGLSRAVPRWWAKGICRPSVAHLKMLGVSNDIISMAENFGLEGSKKNLKFPEVIFDEEFAWFLGLRAGDSDETKSDVGVGNSDPNILQKVMLFFRKLLIGKEQLWVCIRTTGNELDLYLYKKKWAGTLGVPESRIKVYRAKKRQNMDYVNIRFSNLLFRLIIEKLCQQIDNLLERSPSSVKAEYARGFLDAEAHVENDDIKVNQKASKNGLENLQRLGRLLDKLGIARGKIRYDSREFAYIRIPALCDAINLKKFQAVIGFSSRNKQEKLSQLIQIYENQVPRDRNLLKEKIANWINDSPTNSFDIMYTFKLKKSTARRILDSLVKERKIKVEKINRKLVYTRLT